MGAGNLSIMVPLAGDTPFVAYAWEQGHDVTAIEYVPEAAAKLRDSFPVGTQWHAPRRVGGHEVWEVSSPGPKAYVYVGDVFEAQPTLFGTHDVVMDKDAFGAIQPCRREEYARVMASYLRATGLVYLEAKDKPVDQRHKGP